MESAHEILERAAKKGLVKPGKNKTPRVQSGKIKHSDTHVKAHPTPSLPMAKLTITEQPVISDSEADTKPKPSKNSKPRSWHGSNEDLRRPSKTKPSKKKSDGRNFQF